MTRTELKQTITELVTEVAGRRWMRIADLIEMLPATVRLVDAKQALLELYESKAIQLDEEPFAWRITPRAQATAVMLGGAPMHMVKKGRWA